MEMFFSSYLHPRHHQLPTTNRNKTDTSTIKTQLAIKLRKNYLELKFIQLIVATTHPLTAGCLYDVYAPHI
jgi:hypothetical protein